MAHPREIFVHIKVKGTISGTEFSGEGDATGRPSEGTYFARYRFDAPLGNLARIPGAWTSCGSVDAALREEFGGQNLLTLSGGSYEFVRHISFPGHGDLHCRFRITPKDATHLEAMAQVAGTLDVPELDQALPVRSAFVRPSPGRLMAHSQIGYISKDGGIVEGSAVSEYRFQERVAMRGPQIRVSTLNTHLLDDRSLELAWRSVVQPSQALHSLESAAMVESNLWDRFPPDPTLFRS